MKRTILLFMVLCINLVALFGKEVFIYDEKGEKIFFKEIDSLVLVKFQTAVPFDSVLSFSKSVNSEFDVKITQSNRYVIPLSRNQRIDFETLQESKMVCFVNKTLQSEDGEIQIPTEKNIG